MPDTSDTSATQVLHKRLQCGKSYTNDTSAAKMKKFDSDNDTRVKTYFYTPILAMYTANERLQGEKQFHSKS